MKARFSAAIATTVLCLSACSNVSYDSVSRGTFTGEVFVMWVGDGTSTGDGRFVFVPNPNKPLTFTRPASKGGQKFRPTMMYTDGGSVPRLAQVFKGFSPWGYAPAYMVHDWLFAAKHCLTDKTPKKGDSAVEKLTFEDSASIAGEAIKTLVEDRRVSNDDVSASLVTLAVTSPFSKAAWERRGVCAKEMVSAGHARAAEDAIPGSSTYFARRQRAQPGAPVARFIGSVSFD
jgi:hypothetical protein